MYLLVVHLFDASTGKGLNEKKPFTHTAEIIQVALNQVGSVNDRKLAILDKNHDLYLYQVRKTGPGAQSLKLGKLAETSFSEKRILNLVIENLLDSF